VASDIGRASRIADRIGELASDDLPPAQGTGMNELAVAILTTGGTIDKIYTLGGQLEVGPPAAEELLKTARPGVPVAIEPILAKDSLDLTDADRDLLLQRISRLRSMRAVITHGTDTMTETAAFLQRHLAQIADRTLVLTGAMRPAAMRDSDAPFNLGAALLAAQTLPAGVFICMNGQVFRAGTAFKDRAAGQFRHITPQQSS
jgi:L-asparaginase